MDLRIPEKLISSGVQTNVEGSLIAIVGAIESKRNPFSKLTLHTSFQTGEDSRWKPNSELCSWSKLASSYKDSVELSARTDNDLKRRSQLLVSSLSTFRSRMGHKSLRSVHFV